MADSQSYGVLYIALTIFLVLLAIACETAIIFGVAKLTIDALLKKFIGDSDIYGNVVGAVFGGLTCFCAFIGYFMQLSYSPSPIRGIPITGEVFAVALAVLIMGIGTIFGSWYLFDKAVKIAGTRRNRSQYETEAGKNEPDEDDIALQGRCVNAEKAV